MTENNQNWYWIDDVNNELEGNDEKVTKFFKEFNKFMAIVPPI